MPSSRVFRSLAAAAFAAAVPCAHAQGLPVGATLASVAVTGYTQLDADIDGGGEARYSGAVAGGSLTRRFSSQLTAGIGLRYEYEDWNWSGANELGGIPWTHIHRPGVTGTLSYATSDGIVLTALPTVQWAYASGASTGDALNWGAVLAVSKVFSPTLTLGLGAGVFREIDKTEVFPALIVDWKISDRLRLANSLDSGPAGASGIELVWNASDAWEIGAGGAWRHYRFRLSRDGAVPDGIGEKTSIPLLARASWQMSREARFDFYVGTAVAGELKVLDRDDNELVARDVDPSPLFGITYRARF